jgi:NAD(P)-dependent dehydrogenase (short-subunit alcohol dehydrogenase family)
MSHWTTVDITPQFGRCSVITGTGGLGFQTAMELSKTGCDVILAGRNTQKGESAITNILKLVPHATIRFEYLDLASLTSIGAFVRRIQAQRDTLDLLINNAGIMVPPKRLETEDGFELQFATNYLGHFALTLGLIPLLRQGINSRVISVSSIAARSGAINFDDLNAMKSYHPMSVYAQSKLACLMFAVELQRRSVKNNWNISSIATHPGITRTNLLRNAPGRWSSVGIIRSLLWFLFQPINQGVLPTLFAATSPHAIPGHYYGPNKFAETRGFPSDAKIPTQALDSLVCEQLWECSRKMTGIDFC